MTDRLSLQTLIARWREEKNEDLDPRVPVFPDTPALGSTAADSGETGTLVQAEDFEGPCPTCGTPKCITSFENQ